MNIIIFSKNRAMQLDLLLRSISDHYDYGAITVLCEVSDGKFQKGYDLIRTNMVKQTIFKDHLY